MARGVQKKEVLRCPHVLITGAAGFVGHHLIEEFLSYGYQVSTTDVPSEAPHLPDYHCVNICNRDDLCNLFKEVKPDACIHLGAISFVPDGDKDPSFLLNVNVAGTVNVVEAIKKEAPDCRLLFVSTAQVYGPVISIRSANVPIRENAPLLPLSMYSISKVAAEHAVMAYGAAYGLDVMVARPANHTGPGQSAKFVAVSFAKQLIELSQSDNKTIYVGNLESIRDFTDVRDVASAYRLIIERGQTGHAYNITTNARIKIGELLESLQKIVNVEAKVEISPSLYRPSDASLRLDISKLREHTGWSPKYELNHTLNDIVENLRK